MGASADLEQWRALLHTLLQVVQGPGYEELDRSLTSWLLHVARSRAALATDLPPVANLREFEMMISEQPSIWARQWKREGRAEGVQQGRAEGMQQGRAEGVQQGQAELLLRMIERRFGAVPDEFAVRVRAAGKPSLERWALNTLDAATLADVFR